MPKEISVKVCWQPNCGWYWVPRREDANMRCPRCRSTNITLETFTVGFKLETFSVDPKHALGCDANCKGTNYASNRKCPCACH